MPQHSRPDFGLSASLARPPAWQRFVRESLNAEPRRGRQKAELASSRQSLAKKLEPLCVGLNSPKKDTSYRSTRMGEASRESGFDWVLSGKGKNNWRSSGRRQCGTRCDRAHGYDHVDARLDKHFGKLRQARYVSLGRRRKIDKIPSLAEP